MIADCTNPLDLAGRGPDLRRRGGVPMPAKST
jgi:hypothetical protein